MHDKDDTYKPVSCAMHSELELLIMQQQPFLLAWHTPVTDNDSVARVDKVVAIDLNTSNHEEYITVKSTDNMEYTIRLDRIVRIKTSND